MTLLEDKPIIIINQVDMAIHDTYSKRNRKQNDVFQYDNLSEKLKIQIVHIWTNYFSQFQESFLEEIWEIIHKMICEEFGKKTLLKDDLRRFHDSFRVEFYFEKKATLEESLDIIEFVFKAISKVKQIFYSRYYNNINLNYEAEKTIDDLNTRFLENGTGFSYQQGKIIKIENTLLHKEVIIKAFDFLNTQTFKNANDEFLNAHQHFREGRNKECLTDCLKTLETTMKIICSENNWSYRQDDTVKSLIDICLKNQLIPNYLQTQFSSFKTLLESGIPTLRNKLGGHGQGPQRIDVPAHFASYMLYMTGVTTFFLISCQKEIKSFP